jgi:hypothetical protein
LYKRKYPGYPAHVKDFLAHQLWHSHGDVQLFLSQAFWYDLLLWITKEQKIVSSQQ